MVVEEAGITFLLPKPKEKVKEKRKEKASVKAAVAATKKVADGDSGAAEAVAEAAVVRAGKLKDLEETADKEKAANAVEK